jgi:hypothetical protein
MVTYENALKTSSNPADFALLFRGVSAGGGDDWQNQQVEAHNTSGPRATTPRPGGSDAGFQVDRFGK